MVPQRKQENGEYWGVWQADKIHNYCSAVETLEGSSRVWSSLTKSKMETEIWELSAIDRTVGLRVNEITYCSEKRRGSTVK